MIIDCQGHHTLVPQAHLDFRNARKAQLDNLGLSETDLRKIYQGNARRVYPHSLKILSDRGL